LLLKEQITSMKWRGDMKFKLPLVDIPVSRFSWHVYAPEKYKLFNFKGTVKSSYPKKDPFFFRGFLTLFRVFQRILFSPDLLVAFGFIFIIVLTIFSRKLFMAILRGLWNAISGIFTYLFMGKGVNLISLIIVLCIIAMLAAISVPNFRKARGQAREKACYANMRVLLGAVEMYNMDNEKMMTGLNIGRLVKGKFLRKNVQRPTKNCRYSTLGNLSANGVVVCREHGIVESELGNVYAGSAQSGSASSYEGKMQMDEAVIAVKSKASYGKRKYKPRSPKRPSKDKNIRFGATRVKGVLPIKSKFVITSNFYTLERDLIISSVVKQTGTVRSINLLVCLYSLKEAGTKKLTSTFTVPVALVMKP